jgi:hypothetical protein
MLSHESKMELCWLSIDPLAEKYPNVSPYAFCANNPIKFIDPDGMQIIDPASQKQVDALKSNITSQVTSITTQRDAITASATNKKGVVKYTTEQQTQVSELNFRIGELNTAHSDIVSMEQDKNTTFKLNATTGNIADVVVTASDISSKTYTLNYLAGDVGNQIHEVAKHGSQILNGDLIYSADASGTVRASTRAGLTNYDLEVSAYQAQYSYGGLLQVYRQAPAGSTEAMLNTMGQTAGTVNQVNQNFSVTNHAQINTTLIQSMTESAIGNKKVY